MLMVLTPVAEGSNSHWYQWQCLAANVHGCENSPKVVTQQRSDRQSNSRRFDIASSTP